MNGIKRATVVAGAVGDKNMAMEQLALVGPDGTAGLPSGNVKHTPIVVGTAAATVAKTTTTAEPTANTLVCLKFTLGNSAASPTVAFAGGTARAIQLGGAAPLATELALSANGVALFFFDGTILHQIGMYA